MMPVQRLAIHDYLRISAGKLILDVRSPLEYAHAHIPEAVSFPLFSDQERKVVGTIYKQQSRENAIKAGLDFFGPKMRKMVEEAERLAEPFTHQNKGKPEVCVYCWRGGMRSAGVAWLLDLYGFKVYSLAGGYKAFRNEVLQTFKQTFPFRILGGFTGSGKTELIQRLKDLGENVIDLEKLAAHRGSAFGKFNMPPSPRQEMFENLLAMELKYITENAGDQDYILWLEDESQRIGDINIPGPIWEQMRRSPVLFLDIPFEERLDYITQEYGVCAVEKLMESVIRIRKRLGGLDAKNALAYLEQGNIREAFRILLHYYDKYYLKGLHNRENLAALITRVKSEKISGENVHLLSAKIRL